MFRKQSRINISAMLPHEKNPTFCDIPGHGSCCSVRTIPEPPGNTFSELAVSSVELDLGVDEGVSLNNMASKYLRSCVLLQDWQTGRSAPLVVSERTRIIHALLDTAWHCRCLVIRKISKRVSLNPIVPQCEGFCGGGRAVIQPIPFPETEQILKLTGIPGCGGFSLLGLSTVYALTGS
jgi:hypothetical protein